MLGSRGEVEHAWGRLHEGGQVEGGEREGAGEGGVLWQFKNCLKNRFFMAWIIKKYQRAVVDFASDCDKNASEFKRQILLKVFIILIFLVSTIGTYKMCWRAQLADCNIITGTLDALQESRTLFYFIIV